MPGAGFAPRALFLVLSHCVTASASPAHTRAWIETRDARRVFETAIVARSHAGVDRNFHGLKCCYIAIGRPLTRGRGSKQIFAGLLRFTCLSPAHTRAWIETFARPVGDIFRSGRPLTRGRGSKHEQIDTTTPSGKVARSHAGVDRNCATVSGRCRGRVARSHAGVDRNARRDRQPL